MISFHPTTLEDKEWIDAVLYHSGARACEYNFTNLYAWSDSFALHVAKVAGCLTAYMEGMIGPCYLYPIGGDVKAAILELEKDAQGRGNPLRLGVLMKEDVADLESWFPGCFQFGEDRNGWDYLYDVERLATLKGKKLHGKRNHINRFIEEHPDWGYEEITLANLSECLQMDEIWVRQNQDEDDTDSFEEDGNALKKCILAYDRMNLEGGLLRVDGRVIAFTMGEVMGDTDTYDVHFEKAFASIQGAYPMINREFVRWIQAQHPQIRYINREDDMGVEGLRKAKNSYYPDVMIEKYSASAQKPLQ